MFEADFVLQEDISDVLKNKCRSEERRNRKTILAVSCLFKS